MPNGAKEGQKQRGTACAVQIRDAREMLNERRSLSNKEVAKEAVKPARPEEPVKAVRALLSPGTKYSQVVCQDIKHIRIISVLYRAQ